MKKLYIFFTTVSIAMTALSSSAQDTKPTSYGKEFRMGRSMTVANFNEAMKTTDKIDNVIVSGTIVQVCQVAGCWIKLKNTEGDDIMVKFKNHAFTIPKDLAGRTVVVNGTATKKTIAVKERQHLAEDAGMSAEDIAKITEPKVEVRIESTGIVIN